MPLLFIPIKDANGCIAKLFEVFVFNAVAYHIQHATNVRMLIVVLSQPSETLVNSNDKIVKVVIASRVVQTQLLVQLHPEKLAFRLTKQVVEGEEDLLDVEEQVSIIEAISDGMG